MKGNQLWIFIGRTDAEAEAPILWPPDEKSWLTGVSSWCWERLKVGGEGNNRGWDGWLASPTRWTWVWVGYGSWIGKPGVLQSMGSQRVGHDWATEMKAMDKGIKNVYLAVPGASCGTGGLPAVACKLLVVTCGSSSLTRRWTPAPCIGSLYPGPLGKSW